MGQDVQPHAFERSELADAIRRWLYDYHESGLTAQLKDEVGEMQAALLALQADGPLSQSGRALVLTVMARRIRRLDMYVKNPASFLGPPLPPRPSGLFGWIKARRLAQADARAREQVTRNFRRELGWLQLLEAKLKP